MSYHEKLTAEIHAAGEHPLSILASAADRGLPRGPALGLPAASEEDGAEDGDAAGPA